MCFHDLKVKKTSQIIKTLSKSPSFLKKLSDCFENSSMGCTVEPSIIMIEGFFWSYVEPYWQSTTLLVYKT